MAVNIVRHSNMHTFEKCDRWQVHTQSWAGMLVWLLAFQQLIPSACCLRGRRAGSAAPGITQLSLVDRGAPDSTFDTQNMAAQAEYIAADNLEGNRCAFHLLKRCCSVFTRNHESSACMCFVHTLSSACAAAYCNGAVYKSLTAQTHVQIRNIRTVAPCSWMGQHADVLHNLTLMNLTLPGTHDSAAYQLNKHVMPGSLFWPLSSIVQLIVNLGAPAANWIKGWSLTQTDDVGEQLEQGARFLDMRVGALKSRPCEI